MQIQHKEIGRIKLNARNARTVKPKARMLFAICAICLAECAFCGLTHSLAANLLQVRPNPLLVSEDPNPGQE
jgi:hypothetical protein